MDMLTEKIRAAEFKFRSAGIEARRRIKAAASALSGMPVVASTGPQVVAGTPSDADWRARFSWYDANPPAHLFRDAEARERAGDPKVVFIETSGGRVPSAMRSRRAPADLRAGGDKWLVGTLREELEIAPERQGLSGTPVIGGVPQVERNADLTPYLARGLVFDQGVYDRMRRGNSQIAAAMSRTQNMLAQATIYWRAPELDYDRLGIDRATVDRLAEVLNRETMVNPDVDFLKVIREQADVGVYGFSLHEFGVDPTLTGRPKTTFVDHRAQPSVQKWLYDPRAGTERWAAIEQNASNSPGSMSGGSSGALRIIDARKLIHVGHQVVGQNLEGISLLRSAYAAHATKTEFLLTLLSRTQKWGGKVPIVRVADAAKVQDASFVTSVQNAMVRFYQDPNAYLMVPPGVLVEILNIEGSEDTLRMVEWCDKQMLMSVGALAMAIGSNGSGSYALANVQTREELRQLQGFAQAISAGWRRYAALYAAVCYDAIPPVLPELYIGGIMRRSDAEITQAWESNARIEAMVKADGAPAYTRAENNERRRDLGLPLIEEDDEVAESEEGVTVAEGDGPNIGEIAKQVAAALRLKPQRRAKSDVAVKDRNGAVVMTHRDLVRGETSVAFRFLEGLLTVADTSTAAVLAKASTEHRREFARQAQELVNAGDWAALGALSVDWAGQYAAASAPTLEAVAVLASRDMVAEIRSQVGAGWLPDEEPTSFATDLAGIRDAQSANLGRKASDAWNTRLREAAVRAGQNGDAVASALRDVEPPTAEFAKFAKTADTTTLNAARETTAAERGPRIVKVQYSAIMDKRTCAECKAKDGRLYEYGSPQYVADRPPLSTCLSTLGPNGNQCRCIYVYEFDEFDDVIGAPTEPSGIGLGVEAA